MATPIQPESGPSPAFYRRRGHMHFPRPEAFDPQEAPSAREAMEDPAFHPLGQESAEEIIKRLDAKIREALRVIGSEKTPSGTRDFYAGRLNMASEAINMLRIRRDSPEGQLPDDAKDETA